ncbi:TPA: hypothetical protein ACGASF_006337, partial [Pseudomonas aeruginosa]
LYKLFIYTGFIERKSRFVTSGTLLNHPWTVDKEVRIRRINVQQRGPGEAELSPGLRQAATGGVTIAAHGSYYIPSLHQVDAFPPEHRLCHLLGGGR